jgi:hypothetical protein
MYCGAGAKEPRDQLHVALRVVSDGAIRDRTTPKACLAAIDTGSAALPKVQPRDESDSAVKGAARTLARDGMRCLARAGDCPTAWKRFPGLQAEWGRAEKVDFQKSPQDVRGEFENATYGECVGKDQGRLTAVEELALADKELAWAADHSTTEATVPMCKGLIERGKRALASLRDDRGDYVKWARGYVGKNGAACLAKAGDCTASRAHYIELYRQEYPDRSTLDAENSFAGAFSRNTCAAKLETGSLSPADAVANALRVLGDAHGDAKVCSSAWAVLQKNMSAVTDAKLRRGYESELERRPAGCFDSALQCDDAWAAYKTANAWRERPKDERELRSSYQYSAHKCGDAMPTALSASEQHWAAVFQMKRLKPLSKDKCTALHQVAQRTESAIPKSRPEEGTDRAYGECLAQAGDCNGARQALLRSTTGRDTGWVESFVSSTCKQDR